MTLAKIVIISGGPSKTTRLKGIVDYASSYLTEKGLDVEELHVIDIPAEDLILAKFDSEAVVAANKKVEEADAVIVASQVYKASFTGILKTYLDLLPQKGLENKIVLPLMLGGTISHLLAIDYSLKPVLASLGAQNMVKGVYTLDTCVVRGEDGSTSIEQEAKERLERSFAALVTEINKQS
ncbi:NADPH-dependent FMN reductase [Alkalihalobacillus sp. MEB130]|uniref:NADPH-dependent FMN reductase n=1 Tax=Alkalihalobacillus sp. MEB130 TaxID=2976704 RepID=UPI0028E96E8A|nr:NADPH-dependent FMN reductase [Alkalihalobacillus sp. MEB130]